MNKMVHYFISTLNCCLHTNLRKPMSCLQNYLKHCRASIFRRGGIFLWLSGIREKLTLEICDSYPHLCSSTDSIVCETSHCNNSHPAKTVTRLQGLVYSWKTYDVQTETQSAILFVPSLLQASPLMSTKINTA